MSIRKLWHSYQKELLLSSKSWYFAIELGMAIVILLLLLFVMPENFDTQAKEYFYLDVPTPLQDQLIKKSQDALPNSTQSAQTLTIKKVDYPVQVVANHQKTIYYLPSKIALDDVVNKLGKLGVEVTLPPEKTLKYTYHLQGYETDKLKNLLLMVHSDVVDPQNLKRDMDAQPLSVLTSRGVKLSDRQNFLPVFLTLNGSFMSLFIIAAYIFLDRQEGIIKAYAVTSTPVSTYILSKSAVVVTTSLLSSAITLVPIMLFKINYGLFVLVLIPTAFFAAFIGLFVSSYYRNISQAMGVLFGIIVLMMIPALSYMLPSWEPVWVRFIPTFYVVQSFKEILMGFGHENMAYILYTAFGFTVACIPLFAIVNWRFKRTLTL